MSTEPIAAGKSSYELLDPEELFRSLPLEPGTAILDAACGVGNYSLAIAERLQDKATLYAVDLWEEGVQTLTQTASQRGLRSIKPIHADLGRGLPVDSDSLDLCLMATALHDLIQIQAHTTALAEIARALKPAGLLAVIEFQAIEPPPGPPLHIRLAPEQLQTVVGPFGFRHEQLDLLAPYLYLSLQRLGPE